MIREARAILLVLVGTALMHLALFGDGYLRYVRPAMRPYLVASALLLVAVGLVQAFLAIRALLREGHEADALPGGPVGGEGHGGHQHRLRAAWLVALPVSAVFLAAPPALGSYTAQHSADSVARPAKSGFPALPTGSPLALPLADFVVRAVWDTQGSLTNRQVRLTGFALPRAGGGWYLTRLTITCCAADAVTYKVQIRGATAPAKGGWFQVTGVWQPNGRAGRADDVPVLNASQVTGVTTPHDPYE